MKPHDVGWQRFMKKHTPADGRVLLVGSRTYLEGDRREAYQDCTGLDMQEGEGVDLVHDLEQPLPQGYSFNHVDCCSVLEHVKRPWLMAENIENVLVSGGTIVISVPFVWREHGYPSDYWRMTLNAIPVIFPAIEWDEVAYMSVGVRRRKVQSMNTQDSAWLERTEVFGFGRKR